MKKLFLVAVLAVFGFSNANAQGFSAKAGMNSVSFKVDAGEFGSISVSETGFFVGVAYEFEASEEISVEPSLLYSAVTDLSALYVPVMVKYNLSEEFNIQAGPQVNYILEDTWEEGQFGIDIAFGAGYNISEEFFVEARYGLQVSRDLEGVDINTITAGVGYRF